VWCDEFYTDIKKVIMRILGVSVELAAAEPVVAASSADSAFALFVS
jgi:hypothetical protein